MGKQLNLFQYLSNLKSRKTTTYSPKTYEDLYTMITQLLRILAHISQ